MTDPTKTPACKKFKSLNNSPYLSSHSSEVPGLTSILSLLECIGNVGVPPATIF